jgi:trehalose 6-phosphate synthase/phosphatase
MAKLIILSHQLPFVVSVKNNEFEFSVRNDHHAAVYSGIHHLARDHSVVHVGWTGYCSDLDLSLLSQEKQSQIQQFFQSHSCEPVFLPLKAAVGHYEGYCKSGTLLYLIIEMWPLFHYILWDQLTDTKENKNWTHYKQVNQAFAQKVAQIYSPGDKGTTHHLTIKSGYTITTYSLSRQCSVK